ncbi:MAG TPA: protein kinase [Drouetiella sp.]|jgi:serine/threonine protein kinase
MRNNIPQKAASSPLFESGQTLGGRYQVISALGRGGMGVVYHVTQMFLNKELALKTIETRGLSDDVVSRFQKEARTAFAVKHPNVISVDDFGLLDDGTPFLVMEMIRGETLAEKLKRKTFLPVSEAIPMFLQICNGLAAAHELGIVHRDIKPSNIMIPYEADTSTEGGVKIVDFGIATFASEDAERSITHTTEIFGSPLYMSPEQCIGGEVDHRADIYSLGCVLFETLTGTPPFIGENALTTMMKHKTSTAPTLREASLGRTFSRELEHVVAHMLEKKPEQRYQNIMDVAKDLASAVKGERLQAPATVIANVKQPDAIPKPLSLTRTFFFGAILLTTLMSATLAGFAAFEVKHLESEKPIVQVIRDKASVKFKTEDSALPLDDEIVEKVQSIPPDRLAQRLKLADKDGHIVLRFKHFDKEQLAMLGRTKWIKFLDIEESSFPNKNLSELQNLPGFYYLCVTGSNFNDEGAEAIAKCNALYMVSAGGCNITSKGAAALARNKKITYLNLDGTKITDVGLKSLSTMPVLSQLKLRDTPAITNEGLKYFQNGHLQSIALTDNKNVDDETCAILAKYPILKVAELTNTSVTLKGLEILCKSPTLQELSIIHCKNLSEHDIVALGYKAPHIKISSKGEKPEVEQDD